MKVKLTAQARRRLGELRAYHIENGNEAKGTRVIRAILEKGKQLERYPELGQEEPHLKHLGQGHRYLLADSYKIIYLIVKPVIYVTDIFDTRQAPDRMNP
jgi:toxin ParE1/3/4